MGLVTKQVEMSKMEELEKIQNEMTYPGQVKVMVIRELRATSIAR